MKTRILSTLTLAALLGGLAFAASRQDPPKGKAPQDSGGALAPAKPAQGATEAEVVKKQLPSYPLDVCPVSNEKLGSMGDPVDFVIGDRLVRLCCGSCKKGVEAKKDEILAKIDAAVIAEQKPLWPAALTICPVSGDAYEEAEAVDFVYGTRYVKLCCSGCEKAVGKRAEGLFAKIDAAMMEEQRANYPLEICPVSGKAFDPATAKDMFYGVTLVRLCCPRCEAGFEKNPSSFVAKVKEARAAKAPGAAVGGSKNG